MKRCPVCGCKPSWHRVYKAQGYESDGWQLELVPEEPCDECEAVNDEYSFIYDTKKEAVANWLR